MFIVIPESSSAALRCPLIGCGTPNQRNTCGYLCMSARCNGLHALLFVLSPISTITACHARRRASLH